jgi:hypothetical protein
MWQTPVFFLSTVGRERESEGIKRNVPAIRNRRDVCFLYATYTHLVGVTRQVTSLLPTSSVVHGGWL